MNKIYLIALLFISSITYAQGIEFVEGGESFAVSNPDFPFAEVPGHVINRSDSPVTVTWLRDEVNLPAGWSSQVCDNFACFDVPVSTGMFVLQPGEEGLMKMNLNHAFTDGCGTVKIIITAPGFEQQEMLFHGKFGDGGECAIEFPVVSGIDDEALQPQLSLYPNPVLSELNVDLQNFEAASSIEIYNLTGKRVDKFQVDGEEELRMDAYNWNEGMYILSVLDENDSVLETQRFSKVQ